MTKILIEYTTKDPYLDLNKNTKSCISLIINIIEIYLSISSKKHYANQKLYNDSNNYLLQYKNTLKKHKKYLTYTMKLLFSRYNTSNISQIIYSLNTDITRITIYNTNKKYLKNLINLYKLNPDSIKSYLQLTIIKK
jgi:hypothetical protein